jgi:N4-gp56 family major capsid protein
MQLSGAGIQGDSTLEGNEEALVTYTDDIVINQLRHAVRSSGKMTEQRIPFSIREEARMGLQDWWADRFDTWFMNQISGNSAQTDTKYTGNNTVTAPDSTHQIFAAGASEAVMTSTTSAQFSLSLIDQAVLKARTLSPVIRPINTEAGQKYVMFITPEQHYDLRRNVNTLQWGDIQKAAMQGGNISDNPIFTGSLGEYNGVILHESFRLPRITSTGGSQIGRSVLCGAQAASFAFGRDNSPNRMSWTEELFDYGNQLGVSAGCIAGLKKTIYNSADFSTIVVSAGHSAESETSNGR